MIFRMKPSQVKVRLGDSKMDSSQASSSRRDVAVAAIFMHEGYDNKTAFNDIAILQLKERIDWTDMIRPICLPTAAPLNFEGKIATLAGTHHTFLYLYQIILFHCFKMFKNRMGRSISGCSKIKQLSDGSKPTHYWSASVQKVVQLY